MSCRRGGFCPILTIACGDADKASKNRSRNFSGNYIKTKITDDIIELNMQHAKNIYAIAAGMAHGLGYGDNFQSVLMSNGIREMKNSSRKYTK
jgi:glycerol-3-phosphate dehydrogenase (NAD(P)+)